MAAFPNLNSDAGLKKLDEHLLTRSFITGSKAAKDDIIAYAALVNPQTSHYVNVSRWYNHIKALLIFSGICSEGSGLTIDGLVASITKEDGVVDPIAEETVEEKKADEEERVGSLKPSRKNINSSKSWVMIITPQNDETDMKKLEEAVRSFRMAGLYWGASNLLPIGYGIKLLRIKFTMVDDLSHCYGILWEMIIPSAQTYDFIPLKNSLIVIESKNDDEADVKKLEEAVRSIKMEGVLFWGASKLVQTSSGTKVFGIECSTAEHFVCLDTTVKEQIMANGYVESCHIFGTKGVSAWCGIEKEPLATHLADISEDVAASQKATTKKNRSEKSWLMLVSKVGKNEVDEFISLTKTEGLFWGALKVVQLGYGIECLRIIFTIVDDLVCPHTIIEGAQNSLECIVAIALNKIYDGENLQGEVR